MVAPGWSCTAGLVSEPISGKGTSRCVLIAGDLICRQEQDKVLLPINNVRYQTPEQSQSGTQLLPVPSYIISPDALQKV